VGGRPGASYPQQPRLGLRRGHAREGTDLCVRELSAGQGFGEEGQSPERARDPDPLPGRAQVESRAPGEPGGAGGEARVPATAGVEVTDQLEQARGGGVEVRGRSGF
jgi:hypothetical protein